MSVWTEWQTEELKRLTAAGATDRQIAYHIGKTRNAVIGRRHRLGLRILPPELTEEGKKRREQRRNERKAEYARSQRLYRKRMYEQPHNQAMGQVVNLIPHLIPTKRTPYMELEAHHCRWLLDEKDDDGLPRSCGRQVVFGSSWCEPHWHVVSGTRRAFLQAAE